MKTLFLSVLVLCALSISGLAFAGTSALLFTDDMKTIPVYCDAKENQSYDIVRVIRDAGEWTRIDKTCTENCAHYIGWIINDKIKCIEFATETR